MLFEIEMYVQAAVQRMFRCCYGFKWSDARMWERRPAAGRSETTIRRRLSAVTDTTMTSRWRHVATMTSRWRHARGSWSASDTPGAALRTTVAWRLTITVGY